MADLGFIVFRTPPDSPTPDSCLMVMIHESPTTRHFDPEVVSFWVTGEGRGRISEVGSHNPAVRDAVQLGPHPAGGPVGRAQQLRQLWRHACQANVSGAGALLLIFRTPAVIFRLPGHSQREDRLAEEVMSFFGRLVPILWRSPETERYGGGDTAARAVRGVPAAHHERVSHSAMLRDAIAPELPTLHRQLEDMTAHHPDPMRAAATLLGTLGLESPRSMTSRPRIGDFWQALPIPAWLTIGSQSRGGFGHGKRDTRHPGREPHEHRPGRSIESRRAGRRRGERCLRLTASPACQSSTTGSTVGVISQTDIVIARSSELISGNWRRLEVRNTS